MIYIKFNKWMLVFFLIFLLIEIFSPFTFNTIGDDLVYYQMGKLVAEENHPYIDFFYAHPPLQLILYGFLFKFLSYNIHTFHLFFILLTIVNFYLLFLIVKREFDNKIALIAMAMGLFAPTILYNAGFEYGLTVALFFFLLGLKWENRPILQGLLFLLASMYRFHLIFLVLGYTIYKICIGKYIYLKRFIWIINFWLIINGILSFVIPHYFQDVFLYHFNKPNANIGTFLTISTILKINWLVFLLPLILVLFYIKNSQEEITKYLMIPIPFLIILSKSTFFGYYFVLVIPFLAVVGAYTISKINHPLIYISILLFIFVNSLNYISINAELPRFEEINKEIIGDPPTISYLTLIKNNKIMDNEVDTNSMIYEGNIKNMTYLITEIMVNHPIVIVKKNEGVYARNKEYRDYVNACNLTQEIKEYLLFSC